MGRRGQAHGGCALGGGHGLTDRAGRYSTARCGVWPCQRSWLGWGRRQDIHVDLGGRRGFAGSRETDRCFSHCHGTRNWQGCRQVQGRGRRTRYSANRRIVDDQPGNLCRQDLPALGRGCGQRHRRRIGSRPLVLHRRRVSAACHRYRRHQVRQSLLPSVLTGTLRLDGRRYVAGNQQRRRHQRHRLHRQSLPFRFRVFRCHTRGVLGLAQAACRPGRETGASRGRVGTSVKGQTGACRHRAGRLRRLLCRLLRQCDREGR